MVRKQVVWTHQKASSLWPEAFSHQQFWVSDMEMVSVSGGIPKTSKTQNISGHRSEKILGAAWLTGPFAGPQIHLSTAWCQTQGLDGCWMMVEVERKETQTVRLVWKCETEVDLPKLPFQGSWVWTWASNAVASWIYAAPAHPQGTYPYKRDPWDGKNLCHTVMPTMFIHLGRKKTRELPISGHHRPFPGYFWTAGNWDPCDTFRTSFSRPVKCEGYHDSITVQWRDVVIGKNCREPFFSNIDMLWPVPTCFFPAKICSSCFSAKKKFNIHFHFSIFFCHSQNRGFHKWRGIPIAGWFRIEWKLPTKKWMIWGYPHD